MKTKLGFLMLGVGLVFTLSCSKYPPDTERLTEDLAVITQYDTKFDFNTMKTYSIGTSITKITDAGTEILTGTTADAVLAQINTNMIARGFVKVANNANPDFGIDVLYFQNTTVYTYYDDYWGGYYPYYPYYPVYYASYTTGLCNIQLLDLKNDNAATGTPIRWNGFIRGLLTDSHTTAEITGSVDQAFKQTPQLKTTAK